MNLDEEMAKEPEDRAPGSFAALMRDALEFGRQQGAPLEDEDEVLRLAEELDPSDA